MKISDATPKNATLAELGQRLAKYRKNHGFTQNELAASAGIGIATLRRIEDGKDAQMGSWIKLLTALDSADSLDALLPENLRSPMAELKKSRASGAASSAAASGARIAWGDGQ